MGFESRHGIPNPESGIPNTTSPTRAQHTAWICSEAGVFACSVTNIILAQHLHSCDAATGRNMIKLYAGLRLSLKNAHHLRVWTHANLRLRCWMCSSHQCEHSQESPIFGPKILGHMRFPQTIWQLRQDCIQSGVPQNLYFTITTTNPFHSTVNPWLKPYNVSWYLQHVSVGFPRNSQPSTARETPQLFSDPGKKREPTQLWVDHGSGAATKKKGKRGATEQLRPGRTN